jgi:hypothetical protein
MHETEKYDELLAKIRSVEPVLDDGDELSAAVMERIGRICSGRHPGRRTRIMEASRRHTLIAGWISAAAAVALAVVMSSELFPLSDNSLSPETPRAPRREYAGKFKNISRQEVAELISERRDRIAAREIAVNMYLKRRQSHEN